jgi:hypothetical protein
MSSPASLRSAANSPASFEMQRQLDQHRADLTHIDGALRVLATDLDPETIRPKRVYRRNRYFACNELSRLCLGVLRTAAGELLSTDDIAGRIFGSHFSEGCGTRRCRSFFCCSSTRRRHSRASRTAHSRSSSGTSCDASGYSSFNRPETVLPTALVSRPDSAPAPVFRMGANGGEWISGGEGSAARRSFSVVC